MPRPIAELRAKLQESSEKEWMKRVPLNNNSFDEIKSLKEKNRYNVSVLPLKLHCLLGFYTENQTKLRGRHTFQMSACLYSCNP